MSWLVDQIESVSVDEAAHPVVRAIAGAVDETTVRLSAVEEQLAVRIASAPAVSDEAIMLAQVESRLCRVESMLAQLLARRAPGGA